jgi:hypothetical protein
MTDLNKEALEAAIARVLDYPSAYMGGPSTQSRRTAQRVIKALEERGVLAAAPAPAAPRYEYQPDDPRSFSVSFDKPAPAAAPAPAGEVEELAKRLEAPIDNETTMGHWDKWRQYIRDGGEGSWPRDAFEALLDFVDQERAEAAAMLRSLARERDEYAQAAEVEASMKRHAERERDKAVKVLAALANLDERCGWHSDALDVTREALSRLVKKEDRT